jgi:hypothetical protein
MFPEKSRLLIWIYFSLGSLILTSKLHLWCYFLNFLDTLFTIVCIPLLPRFSFRARDFLGWNLGSGDEYFLKEFSLHFRFVCLIVRESFRVSCFDTFWLFLLWVLGREGNALWRRCKSRVRIDVFSFTLFFSRCFQVLIPVTPSSVKETSNGNSRYLEKQCRLRLWNIVLSSSMHFHLWVLEIYQCKEMYSDDACFRRKFQVLFCASKLELYISLTVHLNSTLLLTFDSSEGKLNCSAFSFHAFPLMWREILSNMSSSLTTPTEQETKLEFNLLLVSHC